jgi:hypothetical protein
MGEVDQDVAVLKSEMREVKSDIVSLGRRVDDMATKSEVLDIKDFFCKRDEQYTKNMWRVIFGLLILLAALVVTMFGIQNLPKLW